MPKGTPEKLSKRAESENRFVDEYLVDLNASAAYKRSHPGVADGTARTEGARLLAKPDIQEKISAAKAARSRRTQVTQDRVIKELSRIAFLDIGKAFAPGGDLQDPREMPASVRRAMKGFEVTEIWNRGEQVGQVKKVRFEGKTRALEILLEHAKPEGGGGVSFADLAARVAALRKARK